MSVGGNNPRQISKSGFDKSLDGHFLANRSLIGRKTSSLLLSSSFGANALLYAAFLGYVMGLWALIIQLAWAISFYLLARFSKQVYASTSLHEFLEDKFGTPTRRVAALCSIVGIAYFAGWEVAVARTSLESLATLSGGTASHTWKNLALGLLAAVIVAAVFYTSLWGRKVSGTVNLYLNLIKVACLGIVTIILFASIAGSHQLSTSLFFPSLKSAILALGIVGFITNIVFNLGWQFVDNSSWQSISSTRHDDNKNRTIKLAGLWTLVTVNGVGTLLGALMRGNSSVDSTNALGYIANMATHFKVISLLAMIILLALSAMSLFDGAILSVSQSIIVDLQGKLRSGKKITLTHARIATLIVGALSAWGVSLIIQGLGGSIFNFVYIVIIAQLSLTGPVVIGLIKPKKVQSMWLAIILGLLAGAAATVFGTLNNDQNLLQGAGTITTAVSIAVASLLKR